LTKAVGAAFLGDGRRATVFFAGFFLAFVALLRAALVTFLRLAPVLRLAFFLFAICSLPRRSHIKDRDEICEVSACYLRSMARRIRFLITCILCGPGEPIF
jgi:hypothetical protein